MTSIPKCTIECVAFSGRWSRQLRRLRQLTFDASFLATQPPGARLGSWLFVASGGRRTVGYLWIVGAIGQPNGACIEEIAVQPDMRGEGVGTRLVFAACSWLAARNYTWIGVTSLRDESSARRQEWFRRLGFTPESESLFSAVPRAIVAHASGTDLLT